MKQIMLAKGKITSLDLVEIINEFRKVESETLGREYKELKHKDFMKKIKKEVEILKFLGEDNGRNISLVTYKDKKGEERPCYSLSKDGMLQMLNSESAIVRFKTIQYIDKLEEENKQLKQTVYSYMIEDPIERAKKWIEEQEETKRKQKELEDKNKEQEETIILITNHSTTIEESRKVINALIRRISPCICKSYGQTWGELYTKFNYIQGININGRSKVKGEKSKLDRLTENELYKLEEVVRNWATELNIDIKEVLKLTSKQEEE